MDFYGLQGFVRSFKGLGGCFVGSDGHGRRYFQVPMKDWAGCESRLVLYPEKRKLRAWVPPA